MRAAPPTAPSARDGAKGAAAALVLVHGARCSIRRLQRGAALVFFVALALCALFTARLVYRYDLYEHEPIPLLGAAIALGAAGMWSCGTVEDLLLLRLSPATPIGTAAVAAAAEECFKLLVVVAVALFARREFDDPMDGVVYGSMAGLGAALEESVFYSGLASASTFVPAAELVRLWAHVVLGGIAGFPLGFWRARPGRSAAGACLGLLAAVALHFGWDAVVLSASRASGPTPAEALAGTVLMLASLLLYGRLIIVASARSRSQFAPQSKERLWGWPFAARARDPR